MKKILIFALALIVFTACNNNAEQNGNDDTNTAAQNEMQAAGNTDEAQSEWPKQTTIMSAKPMVVDLFATWCGPCKELAPILDEIEKEYKGEVIFQRVDIDQEPELAQAFNVDAIPTLLFITPQGEYQTMTGLQSPEVIKAQIDLLLKHSNK